MKDVFLSDLADGLENMARDMCKLLSLDPDEDVYRFVGCIRFCQWQIVAEQFIISMKAALPPEMHSEFCDLGFKAIACPLIH